MISTASRLHRQVQSCVFLGLDGRHDDAEDKFDVCLCATRATMFTVRINCNCPVVLIAWQFFPVTIVCVLEAALRHAKAFSRWWRTVNNSRDSWQKNLSALLFR